MFLALGWGCGAALPSQLPLAGLGLHHGPPSPSLSLPCCQVFLWAPWMWCWTPAPGWPRTASCTRPRIHRSTGQWRAVGALSHQGRWGRAWPGGGGTPPAFLRGPWPAASLLLPFIQTAQARPTSTSGRQRGCARLQGRWGWVSWSPVPCQGLGLGQCSCSANLLSRWYSWSFLTYYIIF